MAKPIFATDDVPSADDFNDWLVNTNWARKGSFTDKTSNVTFSDDPDLSLPVEAGAVYEVWCSLLVHSSNPAAGDFKMKFTAPAGATLAATFWGYDALATTNSNFVGGGLTLNTQASLGAGVATAEPWNPVQLHGSLIIAGTAGSFTLQWAQNTSSATITRLMTNSCLSLRRVE